MKFNKLTTALLVAGVSLPGLAFATNGDNLIGLGAQSRALGGTGTAAFYGSENALSNPALLAKTQGTEFAFGGTVFMPDVQASSNVTGTAASDTSNAKTFVIPEVSLSTRINDHWAFGLGMYGTSGMGVDYRGNSGLFKAYSNLQTMKFVPALAYNNGGKFGFGFAPVLQYGSLDINYNSNGTNVGNGSKSDFGYGFNLGGYYDVTPDLTLGLAYQSKINMNYSGVISTAANGFGLTGFGDSLDQPAEVMTGIAYTMGKWMVTGDYKRIYWSKAAGYKDFNWKDQDVFALGLKYNSDNGWWAGVGYNHAKDPIGVLPSSQTMTGYNNQAVNMFNNVFFPAIVEDHFTLGGGVKLGKTMSIDLAYDYVPRVTKTIDTGTISAVMGAHNPAAMPVNATTETTTHSQQGVMISLRADF